MLQPGPRDGPQPSEVGTRQADACGCLGAIPKIGRVPLQGYSRMCRDVGTANKGRYIYIYIYKCVRVWCRVS